MKLYISTGNSRMEKKWNGQEMEFSVFLERLSHTVRTSETMEQYRKMSKAKQDSIKDVGGFVLGKLKGGRRKKANVLFRSGLTLDMDYATEDIAEQIEMFFDFRCLIYSTHKHTPEKPRLRLIIPLSRTVSPDEYAAVARKVAEDIGMELFDDTTYEPSRLMYWPSTSADGEFFFRDIPGTFLNPDSVLERYADWRDSSSWPVSSRQKAVPCAIVEVSKTQEKALNIALNKISGEWNQELLADLIQDLQDSDFDVGFTGFEPPEIEQLFSKVHDKKVKEDDFDVEAELKKPTVAQTGDVWLLGKHRVICGDSILPETYNILMDGRKANLVLTDPPYNVDVEETAGKIKNDNMADEDFYRFLFAAFVNMEQNMEDDASIYVFHADTE